MPFGLWTFEDTSYHVPGWAPDPPFGANTWARPDQCDTESKNAAEFSQSLSNMGSIALNQRLK